MRIESNRPPTPASGTEATAPSAAGEAVQPVRRTDSVRISAAGRALAEATMPVRTNPEQPLSADDVARLRARVGAGAYDQPGVADAIARRIVAAGDLHNTVPGEE